MLTHIGHPLSCAKKYQLKKLDWLCKTVPSLPLRVLYLFFLALNLLKDLKRSQKQVHYKTRKSEETDVVGR